MTGNATTATLSIAKAATAKADVLVVGIGKTGDDLRLAGTPFTAAVSRKVLAAARAVAFTGANASVARIPAVGGVTASSILLVGLGDLAEKDLAAAEPEALEALRRAAGDALRPLGGTDTVALALPASSAGAIEAITGGALLGAYKYNRYRKTPLAPTSVPVKNVVVLVTKSDKVAKGALRRAVALAGAVSRTRDLVNDSPRDLFPASFADYAKALAKGNKKVKVTVYDDAYLVENGFGGLIGVGQGSQNPPRLVKVAYTVGKKAPHLAIVGKGITFDSGGLSLKPAASMEDMKSDMAGAAAALNAAVAASELGVPVNVTAWLAIAENMPSGSAQRPSDVITIYGGKTVEVLNTDAEGRLVMADAIVAAGEEKPDLLVDVATLTGAQVVALGNRVSGVMGTDSAREAVADAAVTAGELVWPMPLPDEIRGTLDSATADIANIGDRSAGMLAAGVFLREFVPNIGEGKQSRKLPWAHLDIAGPSYNGGSAWGYTPAKATGVAVRTLVALAEGLAGK